jgi:hypothetical protein
MVHSGKVVLIRQMHYEPDAFILLVKILSIYLALFDRKLQ